MRPLRPRCAPARMRPVKHPRRSGFERTRCRLGTRSRPPTAGKGTCDNSGAASGTETASMPKADFTRQRDRASELICRGRKAMLGCMLERSLKSGQASLLPLLDDVLSSHARSGATSHPFRATSFSWPKYSLPDGRARDRHQAAEPGAGSAAPGVSPAPPGDAEGGARPLLIRARQAGHRICPLIVAETIRPSG